MRRRVIVSVAVVLIRGALPRTIARTIEAECSGDADEPEDDTMTFAAASRRVAHLLSMSSDACAPTAHDENDEEGDHDEDEHEEEGGEAERRALIVLVVGRRRRDCREHCTRKKWIELNSIGLDCPNTVYA